MAGWAPSRPWGAAAAGADLEQLAAYRCADPVYVAALAPVVRTGAPRAEEQVVADGGQERRAPIARVTGSGAAADVGPPSTTDTGTPPTGTTPTGTTPTGTPPTGTTPTGTTPTGTWAGQADPVLLATARRV